ncbi:MAG: hypothetical protein MK074_00810 [Phycisphaerales bacterium]|nr:hypothetical protein [Phycisphaerales bacterium]
MRWRTGSCFFLCLQALCAPATAETSAQDLAAAHRVMRHSLQPQQDNSHLARMAALRTLKDASLRPVFLELADATQWPIQVHALLGLAELDDHGLSVDLLQQAAPMAQTQTLLVAMQYDLLPEASRDALLTDDTLQDHLVTVLLRESIDTHTQAHIQRLEVLLDSTDPHAVGTAAMVLAAHNDATALPRLDGRIMMWEDPRQLEAIFAALDTLQDHPSDQGVRWADALLEAESRPGPRRYALLAVLAADRTVGDQRWLEAMQAADRHRVRVDLALLRLMTQSPFTADMRAAMGDDKLLDTIATASTAVATSGDPAALVALVDQHHGRSTEWLLQACDDLPPTLVQPALERLIEHVPGTGSARLTTADRGQRAAVALHRIAPDRMRRLLADAPDEGPRQQALLLAALQVSDQALLHTAQQIRQIGLSPNDTMTLLLRARWAPTLNPTDIDRLALAVDGGRLSHPLQTQAAWLMLKHTGHLDDFMRQMPTIAHGQ